jgi:hypothetical protein
MTDVVGPVIDVERRFSRIGCGVMWLAAGL